MFAGHAIMNSFNKFLAHLREPLYRNGYALVLSSGLTSALGMGYWILAARLYSTEVVGINSAILSMMMFLGGAAQFNLVNVLNRFLPRAGRDSGKLIGIIYLVTSTAALIASLVYLFGINFWSPSLNFLVDSPLSALAFTLATISWCIFALQDGALTGLRQATWVPVENTIFAVAKVILLVLFAGVLPAYGLVTSWVISVGLALLPVNILIFRRLIPAHMRATEARYEPVVASQIIRYVSADYLGYLLWLGLTTLLPIIVVQRLGATSNAYYYLSETIAYSLYLISRNMGMSLITEGALDQEKLQEYSRRTLLGTSRLVLPLVLVVVLGTPLILRLFGENYASEGTTLLRLLSLSAVPNIITSLYLSIVRVQRRMKAVVTMLVSLCVLILGLTYLLLPVYGINGIGIAWLVGQTAVALVLLLTEFRSLWRKA
jgi:O-antigen/teichoic acid export membrane protein